MATATTSGNLETMEGTLSKWTNVMKGWQYRFFVLDENAGLLSYYTSKEKMMKGVRRGCVRLRDAVIGIDDQEDNTFTITVDQKTFHFQAQHSEEREKWVSRLEDTIRRHANRSRLWDNSSTFYLGGYNKDSDSQRANHLELLTKRISEADAYLQLMIEQTNKIEKRIEEIQDPEERAKCKELQDNANAMLDHIKHSIVSLQIAKNMAHPINGIYNGPTTSTTSIPASTTPMPSTSAKCRSCVSPGASPGIGEDFKLAESNGEDEEDSTTENDANLTSNPLRSTEDVSYFNYPVIACDKQVTTTIKTTLNYNIDNYLPTSMANIVNTIADGIEFGTDCDDVALNVNDNDNDDDNNNDDVNKNYSVSHHQQPHYVTNDGRVTTAPLALIVPSTSYSSSEGEEDFYDANDDPTTSMCFSPVTSTTRGFSIETSPTHEQHPGIDPASSRVDTAIGKTASSATTTAITENNEYQTASATIVGPLSSTTSVQPMSSNRTFQNDDGSIDYDALYEEEEDNTLSMEGHGSMISHLLSQVKIGMDLTKVPLPTFILERRSLLEMYADYFAHPDLFLRIAELESPRDRIVQVCRWYLSAYHAGRKSSVAKKPYNPILGEVFQCFWDLPGSSKDSVPVGDGPVPWCDRNQLTFLAEQVSHHPPISAFYAEHYNKKISFAAHVWTKSKFLGLSICVYNIGEGIVTLVDRSEEYIVTFPNGYCRSILNVPWIELGGSVEIRCPQTGYHANIEFLTKPFYGGKRNKVTAEVYSPNEKKPFLSIAGDWTGLMEAKWHDNNKTEVFVDVNRIPIFKKQVRPIVEQEDYESRRVWKEVTAGLKFNDIQRATNAKCAVEQQQREAAKLLKENVQEWEQKYFKPVGENWIYTKPLSQRCYLQEKDAKR